MKWSWTKARVFFRRRSGAAAQRTTHTDSARDGCRTTPNAAQFAARSSSCPIRTSSHANAATRCVPGRGTRPVGVNGLMLLHAWSHCWGYLNCTGNGAVERPRADDGGRSSARQWFSGAGESICRRNGSPYAPLLSTDLHVLLEADQGDREWTMPSLSLAVRGQPPIQG